MVSELQLLIFRVQLLTAKLKEVMAEGTSNRRVETHQRSREMGLYAALGVEFDWFQRCKPSKSKDSLDLQDNHAAQIGFSTRLVMYRHGSLAGDALKKETEMLKEAAVVAAGRAVAVRSIRVRTLPRLNHCRRAFVFLHAASSGREQNYYMMMKKFAAKSKAPDPIIKKRGLRFSVLIGTFRQELEERLPVMEEENKKLSERIGQDPSAED